VEALHAQKSEQAAVIIQACEANDGEAEQLEEMRSFVEQELKECSADSLCEALNTFCARFYSSIVNGFDILTEEITAQRTVIFEGAQGALLDPDFGFRPHVTKTTIAFDGAIELLKETGLPHTLTKVGVTRANGSRHGAGPFVTEVFDEEFRNNYIETHNNTNRWQGSFRVGYLDLVPLPYGAWVLGGIDQISLTWCDRAASEHSQAVIAYEYPKERQEEYEKYFELSGGHIVGVKPLPKEQLKCGPGRWDGPVVPLLRECHVKKGSPHLFVDKAGLMEKVQQEGGEPWEWVVHAVEERMAPLKVTIVSLGPAHSDKLCRGEGGRWEVMCPVGVAASSLKLSEEEQMAKMRAELAAAKAEIARMKQASGENNGAAALPGDMSPSYDGPGAV